MRRRQQDESVAAPGRSDDGSAKAGCPRHVSAIGTLVEDQDLRDAARRASGTVDLPPEWLKTFWGGPMPDFVGALRRLAA